LGVSSFKTFRDVTVKSARSAGLVSERVSRLVTVERLRAFNNQFDGLAAYETEESVFTGLYVHNNLSAGLSFDLGFNRNVISDSVLRANGMVGVFLRHSGDNIFHGIQIQRSGEHGIFLAENLDTGGPAAGITFTGIVVADSIEPIFETNFLPCSYGFRPGRESRPKRCARLKGLSPFKDGP
jgi:hypothetical protein